MSIKIYKSKISYGFLAAVFILFGVISYFNIMDDNSSLELILTVNIIHLLAFSFLLYVFYSTRYIFQNSILIIECGFMFKKKIKIGDIKSVTKTNSLLSSPAASLTERILLKFGTSDSIIVSPKRKKEFINELQKINPKIKNNVKA